MNDQPSRVHDRWTVEVSLLVLRVVVGVIFAAHGAQKMFGAFDGPGLAYMMEQMGILGLLVSIGEFFGGLGIIVGFLSRFSAASLIVIMIGAIQLAHGQYGFFLHVPDNKDAAGYEYNLALIGLLVPILLAGPGRWTLSSCLPWPRPLQSGWKRMLVE